MSCDDCKRWLEKKDRETVEEEIVEVLVGHRIDNIEDVFYGNLMHITDEKLLLAYHNMLIPIDKFSDKIKTIREKIFSEEGEKNES